MIRHFPGNEKKLYLTFDDGPDPTFTPLVLEKLAQHNVPATFFVIAHKAQHYPTLLQKTLNLGHAIGNHSLDHHYRVFFFGLKKMREWIDSSEKILHELVGEQSVGFRPPNGICTPHLKTAIQEKNIPLILWNIRFYDTVFKWTASKAIKSLQFTKSGDIILLHDSLRYTSKDIFLQTLDTYLTYAKKMGFEFAKMTKDICYHRMHHP